jgi:hypothetical protein
MPPPTPPPVIKRYYPTLSSVVSLDDFPESLGFLKQAIENLFSKIHYKDLQYKKSPKGDAAFYSLSIVSNKLAIELFGSGISLVLNPDESDTADFNISAFPVTVEYQWKILAYLRSFDLNNFSFTPQEFFELGLIILNISEEQAIAKFINTFTVPIDEDTLALEQFVNDLGEFNSDLTIQSLGLTINEDSKLTEVVQAINEHTGKYATLYAFGAYLLNNDLNETKKKLEIFFKSFIPTDIESYIKDILIPKVRATLTVSAAIEFPRNILYPYIQNGAIWEREPENSGKLTRFYFGKILLYADTQEGIGYKMDLVGDLRPTYSEIGNTGLLLQLEKLKLDLSDKVNIPEADADGRPVDFRGVYADALSVTLPAKWFKSGTNTNGSTLRIGGYNLLIGTGGVSGTFALEAVPTQNASDGQITDFFSNKFAFIYPIKGLKNNVTTNNEEEIEITNEAGLLTYLNSLTNKSLYNFKFPLELIPTGGVIREFRSLSEFRNFITDFIVAENGTMWINIGSQEKGFLIGFKKFDITFKQNKVISSNIRGALEIKKFVHPDTGQQIMIDVEGHLEDNGNFELKAAFVPSYPITLPEVFTYNLKTVELGKEENGDDDLFYIGTSGTLQFEGFLKDTMGLGPIEIERLRIYSDGSIELKGGSVNLIKPIVLKLGPVEITVTAIHYGSHQKEVNGHMRKFNYFGFDGGISVDPLGIEIRGDGVKFYYCTDVIDGQEKPKPYIHIKTIYLDLTLPASTPVAIVNGWLSIPEPGVSKEYAGGLKLQLPKVKIAGSVDMKLMPKYPAFIIDASLDFPGPIPLGPLGIYGFRGLFGYRYVAEKSAVAGATSWYDYYKAPKRGINVQKFNGPDQTQLSGTPISIGAGASLGTSADNGTVLNIKAMVLLSIPSLFMIDGRAAVLSARLGLDDTGEPPFFAFIAVGDDSLELGFGADFKIPTSSGSMLSIYADVQAGFFFKNQKPWYVNIGTDVNPVTSRVLSLMTLKSFVMLSAKGIAAGARGEFDFKRTYGIIRVHAWAYIEVGGKISFERPQFGAYLKAGVGADIDIKFLSLYLAVDIMFGVEASKPFKIFGSFYYKVRIRILFVFKFSFSGQLDVVWEFNNVIDRAPINPMINTVNLSALQISNKIADLVRGVNMLSNEQFELAYLGSSIPTGIAVPNKILEKIIPIDTYIDIKTEKGLQSGENTPTNSVRKLLGGINNPAERYTDLIPPDAFVQGKPMRQVKHKYSLEKIEIKFHNGTGWLDYHPYKAMYPTPPPSNLNLENLKIGQFQKTDGQYNMVRLLATTPFSYTEQGQPGWYVPEQYGVTAGSLFCQGQELDKKCANFEFKPLHHKYYCANSNHTLFSNTAAFQLLDLFQDSYAEVTDETYFVDFSKSLKFDNLNKMQVVFPNSAVQIGFKVSNFASGIRFKYYARISNPATDLLLNPVYGNPDPNALNQSEPFIIEKNVSVLNVAIEYNHPDWRGVSKVVVEPIFDAATTLQISLLTEQIATITENNNLISLEIISGEIEDTLPLENQLHQLACGGVSIDVYSTFINRYDREDLLNYNYSEEFIESRISQIFAIGQTTKKGLISKLGVNGDVVWEKSYTVSNETDSLGFKKIIQLKQDNPSSSYLYVAYATTGKNHYLICINEDGEVFWTRQFNWDNNLIEVQIIASFIDSNFYVSISELIPIKNQPQIVRFDSDGNFVNGQSLPVTQKDFIISSIDIDLVGIVLAGSFIELDGSHGVVVRLDENLNLLSTQSLVETDTLIHDIKIVNKDTYLVSGYHSKEENLFVTKLQENKEQVSSVLIANTRGKLSQLQLNADGFYLLVYDTENGELHNLNQDFVLNWTKEINFANERNGFRNFRFNLDNEKLTFNVYSRSSNGSLVGHANKELQSCLTNILDKPSIKKDILNIKKFDLDIKDFDILLKAPRTEVVVLNSKKIELCPVVVDLCGEEDVKLCILYSDISSLFNECLEDPNLPQNNNVSVFPFIECMQTILELLTTFSDENPNYNLLTLLANQIHSIQKFLSKVNGQTSIHVIDECGCYQDAWAAVRFMINYLDDLGNCTCSCDGKNYTLLHEVCWMTVEDYEYNINIPDQAAIEADAEATIAGINDFIQPVWRPDTSYYVHFILKDTVAGANPGIYPFTYGFTTGGPIGYFHTHEKSTYGDIPLKAGQYIDTDAGPILLTNAITGKVLEDTVGIIRNPDGSKYNLPSGVASNPIAKIAPHPDKYALTSLGQYIDYSRSYPNANGNLLGAKPLFYNDETTKISLFFNKAYAKNFFREWPLYNGKAAQKGMLKIVIKDPVEGLEIINPPALNYDSSIITIPQTEQTWSIDEDPQIPFVLSQYEALFNAPNCIGSAMVIKPKSEYIVITPKHLKPNKLYSAIVNNMYTTANEFATVTPNQPVPIEVLNQTKEVHRFVFKTSRYANFKEQVESYRMQQIIDGQLVEKEALFTIEKSYTPEQVDGAYTTIINWINGNANQIPLTGFSTEVLDNLNNNYQHPFDRVFEGILGFKPLDEAISTEVNIIRNLDDNKVIAILVRNPEPFNNPKMPRVDVLNTIQVLTGTTVDYKVLHSKDYSQAIIMHTSREITSNVTVQFKYKIWNGNNFIVPLTGTEIIDQLNILNN